MKRYVPTTTPAGDTLTRWEDVNRRRRSCAGCIFLKPAPRSSIRFYDGVVSSSPTCLSSHDWSGRGTCRCSCVRRLVGIGCFLMNRVGHGCGSIAARDLSQHMRHPESCTMRFTCIEHSRNGKLTKPLPCFGCHYRGCIPTICISICITTRPAVVNVRCATFCKSPNFGRNRPSFCWEEVIATRER